MQYIISSFRYSFRLTLSLSGVLAHVAYLPATHVDALSFQLRTATHEILVQLRNISDWSDFLDRAHHSSAATATGLEVFRWLVLFGLLCNRTKDIIAYICLEFRALFA